MDAPQGRYRVVEKDGRLVVIDNGTGAPIPTTAAPPRSPRGPAGSQAPIVAGKGLFDNMADALLALAVNRWDGEGRAIIAWEWKENGQPRRWDALLDSGQQRRLGRAMLSFTSISLPFLALMFGDGVAFGIALALALPTIFWGYRTLAKLRAETAHQGTPPGLILEKAALPTPSHFVSLPDVHATAGPRLRSTCQARAPHRVFIQE